MLRHSGIAALEFGSGQAITRFKGRNLARSLHVAGAYPCGLSRHTSILSGAKVAKHISKYQRATDITRTGHGESSLRFSPENLLLRTPCPHYNGHHNATELPLGTCRATVPGYTSVGPRRALTWVEDKRMHWQQQWYGVLVVTVLVGLSSVRGVAAGEQFLPVLSIREGALRFLGIPQANGEIAYLTLLNARDGGINGVKLVWEECETVFDVERGIECYERLKAKGPTGAAAFHPVSTPLTYGLLEQTMQDQIPLITSGIGRSDTAEGRVFPFVFPVPSNYWSQNTAKLRFIGQRAGGMAQLKGRKIAHVYADSAYGQE